MELLHLFCAKANYIAAQEGNGTLSFSTAILGISAWYGTNKFGGYSTWVAAIFLAITFHIVTFCEV